MAECGRVTVLHWLAVLLGATEIILFGGIIYGWSSVVYIYKDLGYFSDSCPANDINASIQDIKAISNDTATLSSTSHLLTTTASASPDLSCEQRAERGVDDVSRICDSQDAQFSLIFTLSTVTHGVMSLPQGYLFDWLGTRVSRIVSMLSFLVAFSCLIFSTSTIPYLLYPGYIALTCAGYQMFLTDLQLSNLVPAFRATVISIFIGGFGSSSIILLVFKAAYDDGVALQTSFIVLAVLCFTVLLSSTFLILPSSNIPHPVPDDYRLCDHGPCYKGGGNERNSLAGGGTTRSDRKHSVVLALGQVKPTNDVSGSTEVAEVSSKAEPEHEGQEPETRLEEDLFGSHDKPGYGSTSVTTDTELSLKDVDINPSVLRTSASANHSVDVSAGKKESSFPHGDEAEGLSHPDDGTAAQELQEMAIEAKDTRSTEKEGRGKDHTDTTTELQQQALVNEDKAKQNGRNGKEIPQDERAKSATGQGEVEEAKEDCSYTGEGLKESSIHDPPQTETTQQAARQNQKTTTTGKGEREPAKDGTQADLESPEVSEKKKTFRQVALSGLFLTDIMWLSVQRLRSWSYLGMFNPLLSRLACGDKDLISHYTSVYGIIQFFTIIGSLVCGGLMDRKVKHGANYGDPRLERMQASILTFALTSAMSVGMTVCTMIPVLPVQYLTFALYCFQRPFTYGSNFPFLANVFPLEHYGKLAGMTMLTSSVFSLLQYPLLILMQGPFDGDPLWVNVILLVMSVTSFLHPINIWLYLQKKKKKKVP